jgi:hypothetical protein
MRVVDQVVEARQTHLGHGGDPMTGRRPRFWRS